MGRRCVVYGCRTGSLDNKTKCNQKHPALFEIPKDAEILEAWRKALGLKLPRIIGKQCYICELHFDKNGTIRSSPDVGSSLLKQSTIAIYQTPDSSGKEEHNSVTNIAMDKEAFTLNSDDENPNNVKFKYPSSTFNVEDAIEAAFTSNSNDGVRIIEDPEQIDVKNPEHPKIEVTLSQILTEARATYPLPGTFNLDTIRNGAKNETLFLPPRWCWIESNGHNLNFALLDSMTLQVKLYMELEKDFTATLSRIDKTKITNLDYTMNSLKEFVEFLRIIDKLHLNTQVESTPNLKQPTKQLRKRQIAHKVTPPRRHKLKPQQNSLKRKYNSEKIKESTTPTPIVPEIIAEQINPEIVRSEIIPEIASEIAEDPPSPSQTISDSETVDSLVRVENAKSSPIYARCSICAEIVAVCDLIEHQTIHYNTPFNCDHCNENFYDFYHYKKTHPILNRYTCDDCGENFIYQPLLKTHLSQFHKPNSTEEFCDLCGKVFRKRNTLLVHKKIHHNKNNDLPVICYHCNKTMAKRDLIKHLEKKHGKVLSSKPLRPKIECPYCGIKISEIKRHIKYVHETNPTEVCEICGKELRNARCLRNHKAIHHSNRSFQCEQCGKMFKKNASREVHIKRDHENVRSFICDTCGKSFYSQKQMQEHINNVHLKLKPFKCRYCEKGFRQRYFMVAHEITHTKETPFSCDLCGRRFRHKRSLKLHKKTLHGIIEAVTCSCRICGKEFGSEMALHTHNALRHC